VRRQLLLTLALVGLSAWLVAQSPPPPPTPAVKRQPEEQHRASKQQDSNSAQRTTSRSIGSNQSTENQRTEVSQEKTDNRIVYLTLVIALAAIAQVYTMIRQAHYVRRGLSVTKLAADAAKESADAATKAVAQAERTTSLTERAVVVIEDVRVSSSDVIGPETVVIFSLKNFGETVAHAVKLKGDLKTIVGSGFLRDTPEVTLAPQGANQWITSSLKTRIVERLDYVIASMNKIEGELRYNIEVTYSDIFGKSHWHKAEGHYVPLLKEFINTSSSSD
jgi:hypothetical protein